MFDRLIGPRPKDTLAGAAGRNFVRGAVIYLGEQRLPFAENLWALPISTLWKSP